METEPHTFTATTSATDVLAQISGTEPALVTARRQMLYPVLDERGRLVGIVTRTLLETAVHDGVGLVPVTELAINEPVVTHPDQTLRSVAVQMAAHEIDRMPVTDRHDPDNVIGIVSLTHLLAGRLRDLQEERDTERILSPLRRYSAAAPISADG